MGLRSSIVLALWLSAGVALGAEKPATSSIIDREFSLHIAAQPMQDALNELARQTGLQVAVYSDISDGLVAPVVTGALTLRDALVRLLVGTDLTYVIINGDTIVVHSTKTKGDPAAKRAESGTQDSPLSLAEGEVEMVTVFGSLDDELSIGSKSGQTLRETPKSVTLMTRERLDAQNLNALGDALAQTTGVTATRYSSVDEQFYSRGMQVQTFQMDGGAASNTGLSSGDMAMYERVEFLRGVDGVYTGAGEPGGVINLVRKRAKATPQGQLSLSGGRWNYHRGEFDVTGPLTENGRLRGRAVGAYQGTDYFFDREESKKTVLFATGEFDLTPDTLLVAGGSYERRKEDAHFPWGLPRYANGADLRLPRSTAFNPDWSRYYFKTLEAFARAEQRFGKNGLIKLSLTRIDSEADDRQFLLESQGVDPVTLSGPTAYGYGMDSKSVKDMFDLSVSGDFELLGRSHRYTAGVDYTKDDTGGTKSFRLIGYEWPGTIPVDVFNFDPSLYPRPTAQLQEDFPEQAVTQQGYYGSLGLQLADSLRLTVAGRYAQYRSFRAYHFVSDAGVYGARSVRRYEDKEFIPSAALSWNFTNDWTAYASYAETFISQANFLRAPLPGAALDPITGDGYEIGVKGEVLGLNTAIAAYRVKRVGEAARDLAYPYIPGALGSACCYLPMGDIVMEGFDVEASGVVLPGWQLFAGYTYSQSEHEGNARWTHFINMTPKHQFKLWTTYQLPGRYSKWTLNAGVIAQSKGSVEGSVLAGEDGSTTVAHTFVEGGRAVWNAAIQHHFSDTLTIALYGENLFDKRYYQLISQTQYGNVYGQPRSFIVTVKKRW